MSKLEPENAAKTMTLWHTLCVVVDASGVAALLARREGWWRQNTEHPTAAAWSRWKGVKDWDSYELAEKYPRWASAVCGIRGTATNHVIGALVGGVGGFRSRAATSASGLCLINESSIGRTAAAANSEIG
jgi:hypothetical protein